MRRNLTTEDSRRTKSNRALLGTGSHSLLPAPDMILTLRAVLMGALGALAALRGACCLPQPGKLNKCPGNERLTDEEVYRRTSDLELYPASADFYNPSYGFSKEAVENARRSGAGRLARPRFSWGGDKKKGTAARDDDLRHAASHGDPLAYLRSFAEDSGRHALPAAVGADYVQYLRDTFGQLDFGYSRIRTEEDFGEPRRPRARPGSGSLAELHEHSRAVSDYLGRLRQAVPAAGRERPRGRAALREVSPARR